MEKHDAVAARVRHQVLLDIVDIVLHVCLQPEQVSMAQYIGHGTSSIHHPPVLMLELTVFAAPNLLAFASCCTKSDAIK